MSRFVVLSIAGYLAFTALVVAGLWYAREQVIATFDNPQSQAEWKKWRDETATLAKSSRPAEKRREQKAQEQPILIVMRDNFGACVATSVLMGTIGYWFVVLAARGALRTPPSATPPGDRR
jgi:hypothetical protein